MKNIWSLKRRENGRINPYPFLLLVLLIALILWVTVQFIFRTQVF